MLLQDHYERALVNGMLGTARLPPEDWAEVGAAEGVNASIVLQPHRGEPAAGPPPAHMPYSKPLALGVHRLLFTPQQPQAQQQADMLSA